MDTEIFLPMFYLIIWTTLVFLFSTILRLKEIYFKKYSVDPEQHRHPPFTQGSMVLRNAQRNLTNLFEFPIFFYSFCIVVYIVNKIDDYFISLAYWYLYLRIAHSIYHIFFNHLIIKGGFPLRSLIWVPSTLILIWMWMTLVCSL